MSSYTPNTDLWLERSRLEGMMLSGVSYGILFLLTIQVTAALIQRPPPGGRSVRHRAVLLAYVWTTFVLATIGFAGNARYTEMIWIDLRDAPGGPAALILDEFNYRINVMSLTCYYIMEWLMQVLLLHRCFVLWEWNKLVVLSMLALFAAMVAMSIIVLAESTGAVFYNINFELAYLCIQVGLTIVYTILVAGRLFAYRKQMQDILGREHVRAYKIAMSMVVESAALYSALGILFIFTFAFHSNLSNLVLFSVSHVQGIAQLMIIIRVAKGKTFNQATSSKPARLPTSVAFRGTTSSSKLTMRELELGELTQVVDKGAL